LQGLPFYLNPNKVLVGMGLGLPDEKFSIAKTDFDLQRRITTKTLGPGNGPWRLLPMDEGGEREIACFHQRCARLMKVKSEFL
jgi:hypothetical protein